MARLSIELREIERSPLRPTTPSREGSVELTDDSDDYTVLSIRSICTETRKRVFWLGLFLIGLWSAAFVIDAFEHVLQRNVEVRV